jgi:hypothetical protein
MSLIKLLKEDHHFSQTGKLNDPEYNFYVVETLLPTYGVFGVNFSNYQLSQSMQPVEDGGMKIVSGWEYQQDAKDNLDDIIDGDRSLKDNFKVYSKMTLKTKLKLDPDDNKNWANPSHHSNKRMNESKKSLLKELNLSTKMSAFQKAVDADRYSQARRFVKNIVDELSNIDFELRINDDRFKCKITNLYIYPMTMQEDFNKNYENSTGKSLSNKSDGYVQDENKDLPAFMRRKSGVNNINPTARDTVWGDESASIMSKQSEFYQNYIIFEFSGNNKYFYLLYSPIQDKFTTIEKNHVDLVAKYGVSLKNTYLEQNPVNVEGVFQKFEKQTYPRDEMRIFNLKDAKSFSKILKKLIPNTSLTFNYFVNQQER